MTALGIYRLFRKTSRADQAFTAANNENLLNRLKYASITLIVLEAYFIYADLTILRSVGDADYRSTLALIHVAGLLGSIFYLILHRIVKNNAAFLQSRWPEWVLGIYIFLYIFSASLASLNSQSLNGNVDAYVIVLLGVSVLLPIRPILFACIAGINHALFIYGLHETAASTSTLVTKQLNTTFTAIISLLLVTSFNHYRKHNFLHQAKLKKNEEQFRKLFEINPYPLILTRFTDGKVILYNKKALEYYELSTENVRTMKALNVYKNKKDREDILKELERSGSIKNYILEQQTVNGEPRWAMANFELIEYDDEACILTGITDITALKKAEDELTRHACIDPLTGVMNRRRGMELLQDKFAKAQHQDVEFIVCFIDINNLKEVNDTYGHAEGDELIRAVSGAVQARISSEDLFFRYGGDEFVVAFPHSTLDEVKALWEWIEQDLESIARLEHKPYALSVSRGIYTYKPGKDVQLEDLIRLADREMYNNKWMSKQRTNNC
jgi:diguanylate cyclase (GGDEF)-like protein/PAS domain S-box-containing protein